MPSTFRDYIKDSKIELPESAIAPTSTNKKYEEVSDSAQVPKYTSETPTTDARNVDYTKLYTGDDNIRKLNPSTPLIGNIVSAVDDIKDSWIRARQNWKTIINGLKNVSENPQMTYWLANSLLRYINGPEKVLPYNSDLDTSNLIVKLADSLGLGNLFNRLGIGQKGGEPLMYSDYTNEDSVPYTPKSESEIKSSGTKNQERVGSAPSSKGSGIGTKKFTKPFYNVPLFTISEEGDFSSVFSAENYLGKTGKTLEDFKLTNYPGPEWLYTNSANMSDPASIKKYLDYSHNSSPYSTSDIPSAGPMGNVMYALETLNALHGYEPFSKFTPRNDNLWSVRLYPYSPGEEYKATREENESYYEGTLTPSLPITYMPFWVPQMNNGTQQFSLGIFEFDWEKYTPVISYDLGFGTLSSDSVKLFNGNLNIPKDFTWNPYMRLTILDDVDATFSKYLSYYFNRTIDKEETARAPIEYCAFVCELIIFKPALKVNFHFRFICVPIEYDYHFEGSADDSTSAGLITLNMQIIGVKQYSNELQVKIGDNILPEDMVHKRWNDIVLLP